MTNVKIALYSMGTAALVLAATQDASAAPPAKGATPPMSIQPTAAPAAQPQRPDTAAPVAPKSNEEPKLAPNSIYAEGLGAGFLYSVNYERVVIDDLAVRAGFSYWSVSASASAGGQTSSSSYSQWTIPITVSYLGVRSRNKMLELGGGMTLFNQAESASAGGSSASAGGLAPIGTVLIGYRLHPVEGAGFHFRVGAMAMGGKGMSLSADHDPNAFGIMPWGYLSLGGAF
jgi:hypothetical protein